jgi:hypothetical protein
MYSLYDTPLFSRRDSDPHTTYSDYLFHLQAFDIDNRGVFIGNNLEISPMYIELSDTYNIPSHAYGKWERPFGICILALHRYLRVYLKLDGVRTALEG